MSALAADLAFDFTFPSPSTTPPPIDCHGLPMDNFQGFYFDRALNFSQPSRHARSASKTSSVYSTASTVESAADSVCTRLTTPPRASPPVRSHGPALLPKIRSQDQNIDRIVPVVVPVANARRQTAPHAPLKGPQAGHARSYTNPETLSNMAYAHMSPFACHSTSMLVSTAMPEDDTRHVSCPPGPLLYSPASFAQHSMPSRRSSACYAMDTVTAYRAMPFVPGASNEMSAQSDFGFPPYMPRSSSPLSIHSSTESLVSPPTTTLLDFLTGPNTAASLVQTISFPLRDPNSKHFWWDVRNIRSWSSFSTATILALPGASDLLTTPVPAPLLPQPEFSSRHPETEASLHHIYASYYLPKVNSALAISSNRPLQLSVPSKSSGKNSDLLFVANVAGESSSAAALFGGKPSARVVGLVRGFDRFNTGMRVEGNIKRVEYLRGLAALHSAMREHGCRYGFILTEIELVVVRNGSEATPFFGDLEVASVHLAVSAPDGLSHDETNIPLTASLALWGLCQLAADDAPFGQVHWKAEIGAPAEGTRRKARSRDNWIPQPQLAEKREAKRSRGWVWPEDAIGRKELGKRGVKYGGL